MPDLYHSLLGHDLGHLRIVAELWGVEIKSNVADPALKELSAALLNPSLTAEIINSLPPEARDALRALVEAGGRIPWATFIRQHGDAREMGAAKRDRERPYLNPASATEALFYHALLARAFFATEKSPQEFAYIPDDLLELIRQGRNRKTKSAETSVPAASKTGPFGREATSAEKARVLPADDSILDDATTLLAALRLGHKITPDPKLSSVLSAAGLLKKGIPQAEKARSFLEAPRREALHSLTEAWRASETFDELRLIPNLICEGKWTNQPLATRRFLLNLLDAIPQGKWWSLASFISAIKEKHPDFQRPAGDYDSWFIKHASDGAYLRGFDSWDEVDGALIRFFIQILHRLGRLDLAVPDENSAPAAFRLTTPESHISSIENGRLKISSTGQITAPHLTPRAVRYQLSRFCEWDEGRAAAPREYHYHLTPGSLTKAGEQGLKVEHLLALLAKHADAGIPPALVKALKRWEANGTEARAENQVVLRVNRPEILEELRKSKAARFLGEPLGPTTVVIKEGAQSKVMNALTEMGLLAEDKTHVSIPGRPS